MKDCCYDYHAYNITDELSATEVNSKWSCVQFGKNLPVWMKVNCSDTWKKADTASQCINAPQTLNSTTYAQFIPVVGVDNITYRNYFCAICNHQNKFNPWELDLDFYPTGVSTVRELLDYLVEYYKENITNIVVPKSFPRRYCLQPISTCKKGHDDIASVCSSGKVGIVRDFNYSQYKNTACALCNGITNDKLKCGPRFDQRNGPEVGDVKKHDFYITINFRNSKATRFTASSHCQGSDIFDNHLKTCVDNNGLVSPQKSPLDKYRIAIWLETREVPEKHLRFFIAQCISDVSPSNIHDAKTQELVKNKVPATYLLTFEVDLTFIQTVDLSKNVFDQSSGTYPIRKFIQPFSGVFYISCNGTHAMKVLKTANRRLACFGLKAYNSSEVVQVGNKIFVNKTGKYYSNEEHFQRSSEKAGVINVCEQQLPNECHGRYKKYNQSEFDVLQDNLSLYHRREKLLYNYNQYSVKNDAIFICHEVLAPDAGDAIRGLITVIFMSLSVVSLFLVLITYSIFSQLRSPPGKNLMNLGLSLLIFDILWLTRGWSTNTRPLCITMAFIQAYFILVSLSSMTKIAHDTMKMFTDPIAHQRRNNSSFLRFLVIWLIPIVHVALCVILRQYSILAVNDEECWITGRYEYIVIFVPVCISMFYNVLCFTRSIVEMRKLEQNGQMLRAQRQEKSSIFMYIKISTLIGLGWTSAFIAITFPVFSYAFIFLTTFQGLYIFLAFVWNKNVLMLYKRLYNGESNSRETTSTRGSFAQSTIAHRL